MLDPMASRVTPAPPGGESGDGWLVLAIERSGTLEPMHTDWSPKQGDSARVLIHLAAEAAAREARARVGFATSLRGLIRANAR